MRRCVAIDKPVITEELIESHKLNFGKGIAIVNEYAPCLTKDEIELNEMIVKGILIKLFGNNGATDL